jgi:integrase
MIAIGRYPDITVEMARNRAMEIVSALARGESFVQSHRDRRDELTLSALFELFLDRHAKPYKKTWKNDESNFNLYLGRALGRRKLSEISRRSITTLMDEVTSDGRSPVTTERAVLSLGRKLFNWAKEKSLWSGENPFVGISGAKKNRRARFLLPHELPRFFKAVAEEENDTIRDFILLALLTGQRRGNVQAMKWRDVDLKHDLRRSMGSWQAINGASLAIIGRSLGHKSPQATAIYARLHLDPVRDSMERAAEAMLRAGAH